MNNPYSFKNQYPKSKNSTLFIPPQEYQNNQPFYNAPNNNEFEYNQFGDESSPFEEEEEVYGAFREVFSQIDSQYVMKSVSCLEFDPYEELLW